MLEVKVSDSGQVTFAGPTGTLWLDKPSTFTGKVADFGAQESVDLPGIGFGVHTTLGYSENSSDTASSAIDSGGLRVFDFHPLIGSAPSGPIIEQELESIATVPGAVKLASDPSTMFQGDSPPEARSVPTTNTGVMAPSGFRQAENPTTTGVTSATPSTVCRSSRMFVLSSERSSKHFAPLDTIQRSVEP